VVGPGKVTKMGERQGMPTFGNLRSLSWGGERGKIACVGGQPKGHDESPESSAARVMNRARTEEGVGSSIYARKKEIEWRESRKARFVKRHRYTRIHDAGACCFFLNRSNGAKPDGAHAFFIKSCCNNSLEFARPTARRR